MKTAPLATVANLSLKARDASGGVGRERVLQVRGVQWTPLLQRGAACVGCRGGLWERALSKRLARSESRAVTRCYGWWPRPFGDDLEEYLSSMGNRPMTRPFCSCRMSAVLIDDMWGTTER